MIEGFVFQRSYMNAIDALPSDRRFPFITAVADYAFSDLEPELSSVAEECMFILIKGDIDRRGDVMELVDNDCWEE